MDGWELIRAAASDRESGAAEIAATAAGGLAVLDPQDVRRAVEHLLRAHPSMAPLWRLASDALAADDHAAVARITVTGPGSDQQAARRLAALLPDHVLTISWSSTVVAAVRRRRPARVSCMRSEPGGEGERMVRALGQWTEAVLVPDEDAIRDVPADAVVVGADAVTPGGVINKVKTRALVESASRRGVPRYAVAGQSKFVGDPLPIGPRFEETPLPLFTAVVGPDGPLRPNEARARARAAPIHPELRPLLDELREAVSPPR